MNILLFLKRIRHCAGFGVQSPTDYHFVRNVIYEKMPYYAYTEIDSSFPQSKRIERWQARLLLRIANFAQTEKLIYCSNVIPDIDSTAIKKGCSKTNIHSFSTHDGIDTLTHDNGTWIVIPAIYKENNKLYEMLKGQENVVIFDLYYLAIAFVDKKRYTEVHIINPY